MESSTRIIVKTKELLKVMVELGMEEKEAIEITIGMFENFETEKMEKCISFATLECGGYGCCNDFDLVKEMTPEEIEQIP